MSDKCRCHPRDDDSGHCIGTPKPEPVYGMCTTCGSVEVALNRMTNTRDLSHVGESSHYPTGYGCEVCS